MQSVSNIVLNGVCIENSRVAKLEVYIFDLTKGAVLTKGAEQELIIYYRHHLVEWQAHKQIVSSAARSTAWIWTA